MVRLQLRFRKKCEQSQINKYDMPQLILSRPVLVLLDIAYYRVDFPSILQSFIWKFEDEAPHLLRAHRFLEHWRQSVRVPVANITMSVSEGNEWRNYDLELRA